MSGTLRWYLLFAALFAAFFWNELFTSHSPLLHNWEATNQTYAWYNYAARSLQQGNLPVWDPFTKSGSSFVGESQTGLFYPLKLLLYLAPLKTDGLLSERIFHQFFVLMHLLGACFMFLCAREVGIRNHFAAFIAALSFTLGGFVGQLGWPYMLDSAIWLPLIFFFLLRSFHARTSARRIAYACCCGLALGMTLLAGSIHIAYMSVMVVLSAACFFALRPARADDSSAQRSPLSRWFAAAVIILCVGAISFAASAVQLLPSFEYAPLARRWTAEWSGMFAEKIPYYVAGGTVRMPPRAILAFLIGGADKGAAEFSPYMGVLPLLLAVIGLVRNRSIAWVKYLGVLAMLAFYLCLGEASLLHGLFYFALPYFDKLWEAGRFIYLTHFAMALLAGFGAQSLLADDTAAAPFYHYLQHTLGWIALFPFLDFAIPILVRDSNVNAWFYTGLIAVIITWGVYSYCLLGKQKRLAYFLLTVVLVGDLYAFNWAQTQRTQQQTNDDPLEELMSIRPVADFLKAQPGPFRVHYDPSFSPRGMADVYGIEATAGAGVTMLEDYLWALDSPNGNCLFNVRYFLSSEMGRGEPLAFASGQWKVFENPAACPRAWVVHEAVVESHDEVRRRIKQESLDPLTVAYLDESLEQPLASAPETPAAITYGERRPGRIELDVDATATGLLVMSEIYYPGWVASVNGQPAHIYKVDDILRGVIVSPGASHIVMEYRPASIHTGAVLSALAFLATFLLAAFVLTLTRP